MATIKKFEDLEIWKLARVIYRKVSVVVKLLKAHKEFRFSEQMKSASGSIMDNIAEGFERNSRLEFIYSLGISCGETGELKSQLYRCLDDTYITQSDFDDLYSDLDKLACKIASFISYLNSSTVKGLKFKDRK
jgi:four helix bundle protein